MIPEPPLPDEEGVARLKALALERAGRELSDVEAAEILGRAMRYLYYLNVGDWAEGTEITHSEPQDGPGQETDAPPAA